MINDMMHNFIRFFFKFSVKLVLVLLLCVFCIVMVEHFSLIQREKARSIQYQAHWKRITNAIVLFYEEKGVFPWQYSQNHSWRVYLLPYLEEETLYQKIKIDEPWNSPYNLQFKNTIPECYQYSFNHQEQNVKTDMTRFARSNASILSREDKLQKIVMVDEGIIYPWFNPTGDSNRNDFPNKNFKRMNFTCSGIEFEIYTMIN